MFPLRQAIAAGTLLLGLALGLTVGDEPDRGTVVLEVSGLRSDRGQVLGALFGSARTWPEEGREIATCRAEISGGRAVCEIDDIAPGTYALAFLHDEDSDGRLDRDWIGIPQEGYGFSNDARPGLGPPSFESASFTHGSGRTVLRARARYGI